jgi:hypothetical protein
VGAAFVFELDSARACSERFHNEPNEFGRRSFNIEPASANVRNAVPFRIRQSRTRGVGKIGAEAVGGGQARALADQNENQPRTEPLCDLVAECYARPFGNDDRGERQTHIRELRDQPRQKGNSIVGYRSRGKTIRDDDRNVETIASQLVETLGALGLKTPSQIWPSQIDVAPRRRRLDTHDVAAQGRDSGGQSFAIRRGVNRIARLGMRQLEPEHFFRGQARAGAPEGNAGWR